MAQVQVGLRLWDAKTQEKLDKDRFRRDLGGVEAAYAQVMAVRFSSINRS